MHSASSNLCRASLSPGGALLTHLVEWYCIVVEIITRERRPVRHFGGLSWIMNAESRGTRNPSVRWLPFTVAHRDTVSGIWPAVLERRLDVAGSKMQPLWVRSIPCKGGYAAALQGLACRTRSAASHDTSVTAMWSNIISLGQTLARQIMARAPNLELGTNETFTFQDVKSTRKPRRHLYFAIASEK